MNRCWLAISPEIVTIVLCLVCKDADTSASKSWYRWRMETVQSCTWADIPTAQRLTKATSKCKTPGPHHFSANTKPHTGFPWTVPLYNNVSEVFWGYMKERKFRIHKRISMEFLKYQTHSNRLLKCFFPYLIDADMPSSWTPILGWPIFSSLTLRSFSHYLIKHVAMHRWVSSGWDFIYYRCRLITQILVVDGVWAALTIQSSKEHGNEEYSEKMSLQLNLEL